MEYEWIACMYVCALCSHLVPAESEEGIEYSGTAVTGVSLHVGARDWPTPSAVSASALILWAMSPVTMYIFFFWPSVSTLSTTRTEESHYKMPLEFVGIV